MKNHHTQFAIMMPGHDFYKENGEVVLFSPVRVKIKMNELKSKGYETRAIPYCEE